MPYAQGMSLAQNGEAKDIQSPALLVLSKECGNHRDSLKGNHKSWFIKLIPSFPDCTPRIQSNTSSQRVLEAFALVGLLSLTRPNGATSPQRRFAPGPGLRSAHLAAGPNQWWHFGVGAPPILVYFSRDWDVHWGSVILTHSHLWQANQTHLSTYGCCRYACLTTTNVSLHRKKNKLI